MTSRVGCCGVGRSGLASGVCAGAAGLAGSCAPGAEPSHNSASGINTTGRHDLACMCSIIPGFAPAGGTLSATSASPARVADDRSKALEDRLVLLQALSHFLIGDPRVGIKTLRAGFQLFARRPLRAADR